MADNELINGDPNWTHDQWVAFLRSKLPLGSQQRLGPEIQGGLGLPPTEQPRTVAKDPVDVNLVPHEEGVGGTGVEAPLVETQDAGPDEAGRREPGANPDVEGQGDHCSILVVGGSGALDGPVDAGLGDGQVLQKVVLGSELGSGVPLLDVASVPVANRPDPGPVVVGDEHQSLEALDEVEAGVVDLHDLLQKAIYETLMEAGPIAYNDEGLSKLREAGTKIWDRIPEEVREEMFRVFVESLFTREPD